MIMRLSFGRVFSFENGRVGPYSRRSSQGKPTDVYAFEGRWVQFHSSILLVQCGCLQELIWNEKDVQFIWNNHSYVVWFWFYKKMNCSSFSSLDLSECDQEEFINCGLPLCGFLMGFILIIISQLSRKSQFLRYLWILMLLWNCYSCSCNGWQSEW